MTIAKIRLTIAAALFIGWLSWLGYAALEKNHGPLVSRAQAAASTHPVFATVTAEDFAAGTATVTEPLTAHGPAAGTEITVANLAEANGFTVAGPYLLLLTRAGDTSPYRIVGSQRSPGYEPDRPEPPRIYPRTPEIAAQAQKLFPASR